MYDYEEIIYDPSMITKNHTSTFEKKSTFTIFVLVFFSLRHHLCDSTLSICDLSKKL